MGLRELRDAKGLTPGELAGRAGVSRRLVGAVEAGRHLPRVAAAAALTAALGVDAPPHRGAEVLSALATLNLSPENATNETPAPNPAGMDRAIRKSVSPTF